MSNLNDGGPAYPVTIQTCLDNGVTHHETLAGMSLRDHFAGQMMQVLLAEALGDTTYGNRAIARAGGPEAGEAAAFGVVARDAVAAAAALIAELQKSPA